MYPVVTAVEDQNGTGCGTRNVLRRIIVNAGQKGAGVPAGETVELRVPKEPPCWYKAVRVYLFSVDLIKYETRINSDEQTMADGVQWNPPLCANNVCWTGTAQTQYQPDSPAQLVEYTIDSLDPATGDPFPGPNNPNGIPLVDLDLSFVDRVYLPVAAETGPQAQYAKYQLRLTPQNMTDTYTGLKEKVSELAFDPDYCRKNSTPTLVADPVAVCRNTNVSPNLTGEVAYVSLSDAEEPKVNLDVPALVLPLPAAH